MEFTLTDEEKKLLLVTARLSIESKLKNTAPRYPEPTPALGKKCGAFVSLHIKNNLRGCIGYIAAIKPLFETIKEMANSAAFLDPRFSPLTLEELDQVDIEISVLSPLEKIADKERIEVGKHGLMVRKGIFSGLLLPQVAAEHGWDRDQFLSHTCQKAGLTASAWKSGGIDLEIFTAVVFNERALGLRTAH